MKRTIIILAAYLASVNAFAQTAMTRAQLESQNNTTVNDQTPVFGDTLNSLYGNIIYSMGTLGDANTWTMSNVFSGSVSFAGSSSFSSISYMPTATCASGGSAVASAVSALVAAGITTIYLPANCTYITTTTPSGVQIIGGGPTTIISSSASSPNTTSLNLGANSSIANLSTQNSFCYSQVLPQNVAKTCFTNFVANGLNVSTSEQNWMLDHVLVIGTNTTPGGLTSSASAQGYVVRNINGGLDGAQTGGDDFYASNEQNCSGCVGVRLETDSTTGIDYGITLDNGALNPTVRHIGLFIPQRGTNANGYSIYVNRFAAGSSPSLEIDDSSAAGASSSAMIGLSLSSQTTGNLINVFHTTTTYNGAMIDANFAAGSGSFTGLFENYQINGSTVWEVTNAGAAVSVSSISVGAAAHYYWTGRSAMTSLSDGDVELSNNLGTGFSTLNLGPATASYPALVASGSNGNLSLLTGVSGTGAEMTAGGFIAQAAPATTTSGQVGYGASVAGTGNCGSLASSAGCLLINVSGTTRYIPYY